MCVYLNFGLCVKCRDSQEATDTFADPNLLQNLQSNHVRSLLQLSVTQRSMQ